MKKIILMCFVLISFAFESNGDSFLLDRIVVVVNKEVITWSDLYKMMEFEFADTDKYPDRTNKQKFFKENEQEFLEMLINLKLQLQEAERLGVGATERDINTIIESIKTKYSMNDKEFIESIKSEGLSMEEYKKKLGEQITISRLIENEIKPKIIVTEDDINKYSEEYLHIIKKDEGFDFSHILIKRSSDTQKDYQKAKTIYDLLKSGEDFDEVAKKYSEGPTAKNGGSIGFIKKTDIAEDFLKVISNLKIGDISEPFIIDEDLNIIKLDAINPLKTNEEIKNSVKQKIFEKKYIQAYKQWIKSLQENAYIDVKL